ncbi:MAG: hypothetical protein COX63_02685 [Candidatus Diapherotrites archaeon CG_4_10_14_0_2_um_filter_31_5]|nr:MAG: hypothetical protein COX63_02685 [Candidatus Diapherotrites archaeon CG_4_10_14_0_2_um_filter_31_5]
MHTSSLLKQLLERQKEEFLDETGEKNSGWWESEEAKQSFEKRLNEDKFDQELDAKLLSLIEEGNVVMDSWTMGYLSKKGFKIWLKASVEVRAERISRRNSQSKKDVLKAIKLKEDKTREIYKHLYGFILGEELDKFDLVIDTENISEKKVREIALKELKKVL